MNSYAEKQPVAVTSPINGRKGGRPPGKRNAVTIALRDRIRMSQEEIVERLFFLLHKGENHAVQLASARELMNRGWGLPVQVAAVGIDGGGPTTIFISTGVPRNEIEGEAVPCFPGTPNEKP